jgi:DNA-binding transcriptional MerR regulator
VTSYKIDELAREAQVSPRTIRYYVQRGLLPAPAFHGKDTTYERGHLLRLQVIKKLQQSHMPLEEIQARITAASAAELERMLSQTQSRAGASAEPAPRGGPYRAPGARDPLPVHIPSAAGQPERWERIHVMPGLEVHVRSDAGPEARRAAREIQSQYGQGSFEE